MQYGDGSGGNRRMKLLFLTRLVPQARGISGSIIIYNRLRYLAQRGHEVSVLSFAEPGEVSAAEALRPWVRTLDLVPAPLASWRARFFSTRPSPFRELYSRAMACRLGDLVSRERHHAVLAEYSVMGQYLYWNPYLPAVRRLVSCHECCTKAYATVIRLNRWTPAGLAKRIGFNGVREFEFAMYRNMDHILVLTPQERRVLLRYAPNLRISVVPHGVDTSYFTPTPDAGREECLLFVGYYHNESNRDAVRWFGRTVWPRLRKEYPQLRFFVVGRGAQPSLIEWARRDPRVVMTGEVDDVRPYLARARVFICPIRIGSGFRAKILEALAAGVPVVSTSLGAEGIAENADDALLLADTPERMLSGIRLLLSDSRLRAAMGAKARALAVRRFDRDRGLAELDDVLAGMMA